MEVKDGLQTSSGGRLGFKIPFDGETLLGLHGYGVSLHFVFSFAFLFCTLIIAQASRFVNTFSQKIFPIFLLTKLLIYAIIRMVEENPFYTHPGRKMGATLSSRAVLFVPFSAQSLDGSSGNWLVIFRRICQPQESTNCANTHDTPKYQFKIHVFYLLCALIISRIYEFVKCFFQKKLTFANPGQK